MSNDPKDAEVDSSKLMLIQQQPSVKPIIPPSNTPSLLTQCNESANDFICKSSYTLNEVVSNPKLEKQSDK